VDLREPSVRSLGAGSASDDILANRERASDSGTCFHCGEPLPDTGVRTLDHAGVCVRLCCVGCEAAVLMIQGAGLERYYEWRTAPPLTPAADEVAQECWDGSAARSACSDLPDGVREITVALEGMRCAACGWLIERVAAAQDGVESVRVNAATRRASLRWRPDRIALSRVLAPIRRLGYEPHLATDAAAATRARRTALKRLVVAGVGAMQAMMFAEALYFGGDALDLAMRDLFRWLGLLTSTPVVLYAGWPFLRGAWLEWRARAPGMDFLVGSMVLLAFGASFLETLRGGAEVYFDSAVMFVFLLLVARHLDAAVRARSQAQLDAYARAQPARAWRERDGAFEAVPTTAIEPGDVLRLRPGETLAADGVLQSDLGAFDEALLTGEAKAVLHRAGDEVLAGSLGMDASVRVRVTRVGAGTWLATLSRRVARAASERPRAAQVADRIASRFVLVLLFAIALAAGAWAWIDAPRALPVVLAMLAVSCPCALSLAVPAALAASHARLARAGVLTLDADALATLARVDLVLFDKTGTLTRGEPGVRAVEVVRKGCSETDALALAAALERESAHPLARAFAPHARAGLAARDVRTTAGQGIEGVVDGQPVRLGTPAYAGDADAPEDALVLADAHGVLARIQVADQPRSDANATVGALARDGLGLAILSGDGPASVAAIARHVGIDAWRARCSPEDKLAYVRARQAEGRVVAMVGDGINDAAVLAGADVSFALGSGAALAHASADVVLAGNRLDALVDAWRVARATRRIVRQNLAWALAYNALALPAAALGLVPAWAAAIGMTLSSLVVTLNAARLVHARHLRPADIRPASSTPVVDRVNGVAA